PLPHVEDPSVLEDLALLEQERRAVDGRVQAHPVGRSDEGGYGAWTGAHVVDPGDEGGGRGERAPLGQRPARADVAVSDGEERFDLVLAGQVEALLDHEPGWVPVGRDPRHGLPEALAVRRRPWSHIAGQRSRDGVRILRAGARPYRSAEST